MQKLRATAWGITISIVLAYSAGAALERTSPPGKYMNKYEMSRTADGGYLITPQQGFQRIFVKVNGKLESLYLADNGQFHSSNFRCDPNIPHKCHGGKPLSESYLSALEKQAEGKIIVTNDLSKEIIYVKGPDGKTHLLQYDGKKWFSARVVGGGGNPNASSGGSTSGGSGSGSSGGDFDKGPKVPVDREEQVTNTPGKNGTYDDDREESVSLCKLAGTCGGGGVSSSGSGSGSSSSGSVSNFGSAFLGFYKQPPAGLKAPVRLVEMFTGRSNGWAPSEGGGGMYGGVARNENNPERMSIVTYALIPSSEKQNQPLQRCASGQFDEHYRKFGQAMKAQGISSIIIRPGWEWTLNSWAWGTGNNVSLAPVYAQCFRRFVDSVRQVYPENNFLIDWNIHQDASPASMAAGWPGDNYVDIIGVDIYDAYYGPASCANSGECRWRERTQKVLDKVTSFARAKNKPISIPELGIWTSTGGDTRGGGDNPYFIQKICEFVKNPANRVVYYAYFNANADGDHRLETHPKSFAAFNQYCVGNPGNPHVLLKKK